MEPKKRKRLIRVLYLLLFAIVIGLVIFISRGPYISNALKRLILPELETALRQKVIAKKIYVNIFPFFVEAKSLRVFDEDGKRIIYAKRVKGYIEPLGLFRKHITIRRLVIKEPAITTDKESLDDLIKNSKTYLEKESIMPFKVNIKAVEISDGTVSLSDKGIKSFIAMNGLGGEVILGTDSRITMTVKKFDLRKEGLPELSGDIHASFVLRKDEIEIKDLKIGSHGSEFKSSGLYSKGKLILKTDTDLLVDTLKHIFNLKERKEGKTSLQPSAFSRRQWEDISIDLDLREFLVTRYSQCVRVPSELLPRENRYQV